MRAILIAMLAAGGIGFLSTSGTFAAPVNNATIAAAAAKTSLVIQARAYCRLHYTATSRYRFLHWGRC
jgi:hypothetical protein